MTRTIDGWLVLGATLALSSGACSVIVGTDGYRPCEGDECAQFGGAGGSGGAGSSSSSASGSSSGSGGGGACSAGSFPVTVNRTNDVEIRTEQEGNDFYDGNPPTQCVVGGSVTFGARCEGSGNNPVTVTWGNDACGAAPSVSCTIQLDGPEVFDVTRVGSCPSK